MNVTTRRKNSTERSQNKEEAECNKDTEQQVTVFNSLNSERKLGGTL